MYTCSIRKYVWECEWSVKEKVEKTGRGGNEKIFSFGMRLKALFSYTILLRFRTIESFHVFESISWIMTRFILKMKGVETTRLRGKTLLNETAAGPNAQNLSSFWNAKANSSLCVCFLHKACGLTQCRKFYYESFRNTSNESTKTTRMNNRQDSCNIHYYYTRNYKVNGCCMDAKYLSISILCTL